MADPISMTLMAASTAISAIGSFQQAKAQEQAAKQQAAMERQRGLEEYAQATKQAAEEARKGKLLQSQARAAMAGGGGTTTDPGATKMLAEIEDKSTYNVLASMYQGKSAKQQRDYQASVTTWEGKQRARASRMEGLSTLISGGMKAYSGYKDWKMQKEAASIKPWTNPDTGQVFTYGRGYRR